MIAYLHGEITHKTPAFIYIECNGVGYHVNISLNTYSKLEGLNKVKIYTYMSVREDDQSLYGFFDDDERSIFILLISVSGIGVNTARVILSYMNPDEIRTAIIHDDAFAFSKAKGVGPKTAKRIILDLKDKVIRESGQEQIVIQDSSVKSIHQEAVFALVALGFPKPLVEKQVRQIVSKQPEISQVEELIKMALKQMG
ncbi:MAG TPA: Holliday junction branch migration protein RuvA [Saprospiraceae bacterium]|nr:Holliday junction branch migration protein RuvA [Saprospiraceae bacterium]HRO08374.1 Holliday junction branch migration protein RuvA [Saprospiraceae bacterium]HRO73648.1 Holliday junction branch migration protein RuvA [Saprospiraceae bacterium]HRP41677.1 Holliday junction branch migration protein RuvA [Saprospiraceae bacterium]